MAVNPVQSCNACNICRAGKVAVLPEPTVLGVTMNGGFAEFAKTKIAHAYKLPESLTRRAGRVRRDALVGRLRLEAGRDRARATSPSSTARARSGSRWSSSLNATREPASRWSARGTTGSSSARQLGADHVWNTCGRVLAVLGRRTSRRRSRRRTAARLADRVLVGTATVDANQQAIEISGNGLDRRPDGPRRAERHDLGAAALEPGSGQDDQVLVALPASVADDDQDPRDPEDRHGTIITHSASLDGISAAIERCSTARTRSSRP